MDSTGTTSSTTNLVRLVFSYHLPNQSHLLSTTNRIHPWGPCRSINYFLSRLSHWLQTAKQSSSKHDLLLPTSSSSSWHFHGFIIIAPNHETSMDSLTLALFLSFAATHLWLWFGWAFSSRIHSLFLSLGKKSRCLSEERMRAELSFLAAACFPFRVDLISPAGRIATHVVPFR